jgi:hypothetical protein
MVPASPVRHDAALRGGHDIALRLASVWGDCAMVGRWSLAY